MNWVLEHMGDSGMYDVTQTVTETLLTEMLSVFN